MLVERTTADFAKVTAGFTDDGPSSILRMAIFVVVVVVAVVRSVSVVVLSVAVCVCRRASQKTTAANLQTIHDYHYQLSIVSLGRLGIKMTSEIVTVSRDGDAEWGLSLHAQNYSCRVKTVTAGSSHPLCDGNDDLADLEKHPSHSLVG